MRTLFWVLLGIAVADTIVTTLLGVRSVLRYRRRNYQPWHGEDTL